MLEEAYLNLQPGDVVKHVMTPWKPFIVVSIKETKSENGKPIYWVCEQSAGLPVVHIMSNENEWEVVSFVQRKVMNDSNGTVE